MEYINLAARWLTRAAALFLLAMMGINVIDVILRAAFDAPIFGTYEIVELTLAPVAFFAIPEAFLRKEHVAIELVDQIAPEWLLRFLNVFGIAVTAVFFALLVYYMIPPAVDFIEFNEVSFDLHIPMIWRGSLVLFAMIAGLIVVIYLFWRELLAYLGKGERP